MQVADQQQLKSTEWERVTAHPPKGLVYCVQQVSPHHTYLVYYKEVKTPDQRDLGLVEFKFVAFCPRPSRDVNPERQLEKGMEGHSTGIDGCYTSRGGHYQSFA